MMKLEDAAIAEWKDWQSREAGDAAHLERWTKRVKQREAARPGLLDLLERFHEKKLDLEAFRQEFDSRSRTDWEVFGLKGPSGAMFLNKLAKHMPDTKATEEALRRVLPAPKDVADARERLSMFVQHLQDAIDRQEVSTADLQPGRATVVIAALWHVQEPDRWPALYLSARKALGDLYESSADMVATYFSFREAYLALRAALDLDAWSLERLCTWEGDEEGETEPEPVVDAPAKRRVWLIAPGPNARDWAAWQKEGIAAIGWGYLGDLRTYPDYSAILNSIRQHVGGKTSPHNQAWACYQFAREMKSGDIVVAKKGRKSVIGWGVVQSDYMHDPQRQEMRNIRMVKWEHIGEWNPRERPLVMKTLTDITRYSELVRQIEEAIGIAGVIGDDDDDETEEQSVAYGLEDAMKDLFIERPQIERMLRLLRHKKNLVLQGPPGVGKTFVAKRLAYLLMEERAPEQVKLVQFHQSYAYEDFVQGYRPDGEGFARKDGPFLRICDLARQDLESPYVLIIDEINRGNLSKIFGELMLLIEADKRGEEWSVDLAYSNGEQFSVPPNLYLIGTMNTADRSLALVDYALRRRFAFVDVEPAFETSAFDQHLKALGAPSALRQQIGARMAELNRVIRDDPALGDGFLIGHSYFCAAEGRTADDAWFDEIIEFEIEPLLREYWFDDRENVKSTLAALRRED